MKKVTFCLVCGSTAPADAERCPSCSAPLRTDREENRHPRRRLELPSPLVILCILAGIAVLIAFVAYVVSG